MNILGIDTSSKAASVALYQDGKLLGDCVYNHGKTHSAYIAPMIEAMLTASDLTIGDMDYFACGVGPGSFTGVRIGITMTKTFSLVKSTPCVGVDSLYALAAFHGNDETITIAIEDARRNRVFACGVCGKEIVLETNVYELDELCAIAKAYNKRVKFVGGGAMLYGDQLRESGFVVADNTLITGSSIIMAAMEKIEAGQVDTAISLMPKYLLKSQAEQEKA